MNTKIKEWIMNCVKKWFPNAEMYMETETSASIDCGKMSENVFQSPDERTLKECVNSLNSFMARKAFPMQIGKLYYDYGEPVLGGITVNLINIWQEDLNQLTMTCIVNCAIRNKLPWDNLLNIRLADNIEYAIKNSDDGIGIESSEYKVDFTVEAIDYCDCDGDPDDPNWVHYTVPCLWYYSGHIGDFAFEGLSSSQNLGVGKAIRAIYKIAKNHQLSIAAEIEKNAVRWHSYGFCH